VYFSKLLFKQDEQEFSVVGVEGEKIWSHTERNQLKNKSILKVNNTCQDSSF